RDVFLDVRGDELRIRAVRAAGFAGADQRDGLVAVEIGNRIGAGGGDRRHRRERQRRGHRDHAHVHLSPSRSEPSAPRAFATMLGGTLIVALTSSVTRSALSGFMSIRTRVASAM